MRVEKVSEGVSVADLEPSNTPGWSAVYVIEGTDSLAIIDPGPRASLEGFEELIETLRVDRYRVVYLALTHVHIDHSGVVGDLVELLPNAKVLVHPRGVRHLVDPSRLWSSSLEVLGDTARLLGEPRPVPQSRVIALEHGAVVDLGGLRLTSVHTPGHASHHVSYLLEPAGVLFAGDSIANHFQGRIYPVTVHPFNGEEYLSSLELMLGLRPKAVAVTHYGCVSDSPEVFIQRARDKLISWLHQTAALIKEGVSGVDEVYRRILSRDVELAYARRLEDSMPAFRGSTFRVVVGLYNYVLSRFSGG